MQTVNATIIDQLELLDRIETEAEFLSWVGKDLQTIFPHGAFICELGRIQRGGVFPIKFFTSNFPADYLRALKQSDGLYDSAVIKNWITTGEAQLLDSEKATDSGMDNRWLERFKSSGLKNIAAHGVYDYSRQHASYFSFHNIPESPGEKHRRLLSLLVPHMHTALLRIIHQMKADARPKQARRAPTPRELEVLTWVGEGKTSAEIASILGVAPRTIRNQIQSTLVKLRVNTRVQAVAKAIKKGLVVIPQEPDSMFGKKTR